MTFKNDGIYGIEEDSQNRKNINDEREKSYD